MTHNKVIIWLVGLFILLDIAGVSWYVSNKYGNQYKAQTAIDSLTSVPGAPLPNPGALFSGEVRAISASSITVFSAPDQKEATYSITTTTEINKLTQKDPEVFQQEVEAATKKPGGGLPPSPLLIKQITAEDIKVGNLVVVTPISPESATAKVIVVTVAPQI